MVNVVKDMGLNVAQEIFADRNYMADGSLTPRTMENAMIHDEDFAVKRVVEMVKENCVEALDGTVIKIQPNTVCVHGDEAKALIFVDKLRNELLNNDIEVKSL